MKRCALLLVLLVAVCLLPACDGNAPSNRGTDGPDYVPGSDVVSDTQDSSPIDPPDGHVSGDDGSVESDVAGELPPTGDQSVRFIIRNVSDHMLYLRWAQDPSLLNATWDTGPDHEPVHFGPAYFWPPFCTQPCTDFEDRCGCIDCAQLLAVLELDPGEEYLLVWGGDMIYDLPDTGCGCGCYQPAEWLPMHYTAEVCVNDSYVCEWECYENGDFVIMGADVVGESRCTSQSFDLSERGGEVVFEVR